MSDSKINMDIQPEGKIVMSITCDGDTLADAVSMDAAVSVAIGALEEHIKKLVRAERRSALLEAATIVSVRLEKTSSLYDDAELRDLLDQIMEKLNES